MPQIPVQQPQVQDIYSFGFDKNLNKIQMPQENNNFHLTEDALYGNIFSAGTIEGNIFQTAAGKNRVVLSGRANNLLFPSVRMYGHPFGDFRWEVNANSGICYLYDQTGLRYNIMIDASGNIGIDKEIPSSKLDVNGDILGTGYMGTTLSRWRTAAISAQTQSQTINRMTISGIADGDSGLIKVVIGGNINTIDRLSTNGDISFFKTGGVSYFNAVEFAVTGLDWMNIGIINSSGNIVVQSVTGAFGAGQFDGVMYVFVMKNTPGLNLSLI